MSARVWVAAVLTVAFSVGAVLPVVRLELWRWLLVATLVTLATGAAAMWGALARDELEHREE